MFASEKPQSMRPLDIDQTFCILYEILFILFTTVTTLTTMVTENGRHDTPLQVAVLGPLGTYTHEAAHSRFGATVRYNECETIRGIFDAVASMHTLGVVPQENSIFGSVIETYDALRKTGFVCGEITLRVQHCLVARTDIKFGDIRRVYSHEQALGQCRHFLTTVLPSATLIKTTSTAAAARMLLDNDADCAAICSQVCVTLFEGLSVLEEGIQDVKTNFTRFYVLSRSQETGLQAVQPHKALLRISHTEKALCVSTVFKCLSESNLHCSRIDRRPSRSIVPFIDTYLVEIEQTDEQPSEDWRHRVDGTVQRLREESEAQLIGFW